MQRWLERKKGKENVWPTAGVKLYPRGGNRPLIYPLTLWTDNPRLALSRKYLYNTHTVVQKYNCGIYFLGWNSSSLSEKLLPYWETHTNTSDFPADSGCRLAESPIPVPPQPGSKQGHSTTQGTCSLFVSNAVFPRRPLFFCLGCYAIRVAQSLESKQPNPTKASD